MTTVLLIAYTIWAMYSGWKITTKKIPSLNKPGTGYLIGKLVLTVIIGYIFGGLYFLLVILSLMGFVENFLK